MEMIKTSLYTTLFLLKTKSNFVFEPLSGISPSPPVSVDICVSVCVIYCLLMFPCHVIIGRPAVFRGPTILNIEFNACDPFLPPLNSTTNYYFLLIFHN
jgi:hypothetical protein